MSQLLRAAASTSSKTTEAWCTRAIGVGTISLNTGASNLLIFHTLSFFFYLQLICVIGNSNFSLAEQIMNYLLGRQVDSNYMVRIYCIRGLGNMASIGGNQVCMCTCWLHGLIIPTSGFFQDIQVLYDHPQCYACRNG